MSVLAVDGKEEGVAPLVRGFARPGRCPRRQAWCWGWVFTAVQSQGVLNGEVMFNLPGSFSDFSDFWHFEFFRLFLDLVVFVAILGLSLFSAEFGTESVFSPKHSPLAAALK